MKVINLISGPRNISTALMYSFAHRKDCVVLDEPFYGYYLSKVDIADKHPSHEAIVQAMECDEMKIVAKIEELAAKQKVFIKGMAHHFLSDTPNFILDWTNVILIRHPSKLIASFSKVIPNPTLSDIGIKKASELVTFLQENRQPAIVIDSDELMVNPKRYLKKLCQRIDISFTEDMLSWKTGGIPEDGIWAKHWYENVHRTSGFEVQQRKPETIPPHLGSLLAEALPYYDRLQQLILKND